MRLGNWRVLLCVFSLFLAGGGVRADLVGGDGLVPVPQGDSVSVTRGESVTITLAAKSSSLKGVEFLIREKPKYGSLTEPRAMAGRTDRAVVVYTPLAKGSASADSFTFAARHVGGGVSKAATVTIRVREPVARLVPARRVIGFESVVVDGRAEKKLVLRNDGNGVWKGTLDVAAPFTVGSGSGEIRVGVGEEVEVPLVFAPVKEGAAEALIELPQPEGAQGRSLVRVSGMGILPVSVVPGVVELEMDAEAGVRRGGMTVANATGEDQVVVFSGDKRLGLPGEVRVGAGRSVEVPVALKAGDVGALDGTILARVGRFEIEVGVEAEALPAVLEVEGLEVGKAVSFEEVEVGKEVRRTVVLFNAGGQEAVARVQAGPPFRLASEDLRNVTVESGEEVEVEVVLEGGYPGEVSGVLTVQYGSRILEVDLEGEIFRREGEPLAPNTSPLLTRDAGKIEGSDVVRIEGDPSEERAEVTMAKAYLAGEGFTRLDAEINREMESLPELRVVERGKGTVTVSLGKPVAGMEGFILERAFVYYQESVDSFFKDWVPLAPETLKARRAGEEIHVTITGLGENQSVELRGYAVDGEGKVSPASKPVIVSSGVGFRFPWAGVFWVLVVLILVGVAIWFLKREWVEAARDRWEGWREARRKKRMAGEELLSQPMGKAN